MPVERIWIDPVGSYSEETSVVSAPDICSRADMLDRVDASGGTLLIFAIHNIAFVCEIVTSNEIHIFVTVTL